MNRRPIMHSPTMNDMFIQIKLSWMFETLQKKTISSYESSVKEGKGSTYWAYNDATRNLEGAKDHPRLFVHFAMLLATACKHVLSSQITHYMHRHIQTVVLVCNTCVGMRCTHRSHTSSVGMLSHECMVQWTA